MSWPIEYSEFFQALGDVRQDGHETWTAFCPTCQHRDGRRGLRIRIGQKGGLVVKCMRESSGCHADAILAALSLTFKHLFPPDQRVEKKPRGKIEMVYDYRQPDGSLLFQVVRVRLPDGDKDFYQRRPNPGFDRSRAPHHEDNPRWVPHRKGMPLCLYRLPELAESLARSPDRWVFLVEGEKAVDFLRGDPWRLTATTSPGGAGKWNCLAFCQALAGRRVAVVADNDADKPPDKGGGPGPGPLHALDACRSLYGMAAEVRLLGTMPGVKERGGLDDWLAARADDPGQAKRDLRDMVECTPPWKPSMADIPPAFLAAVGESFRLGLGVTGRGRAGPSSLEEWLGLVRRDWIHWEQAAALDGSKGSVAPATLRVAAQLLAGASYPWKGDAR